MSLDISDETVPQLVDDKDVVGAAMALVHDRFVGANDYFVIHFEIPSYTPDSKTLEFTFVK